MKTLLLVFFVLVAAAFAQLPDAPSTVQPAAKCGPWSCWTYSTISNTEVLKSKAFWATFLGDFALTSFDSEMTHEGLAHRRCVEGGGVGFPAYPSRRQLYVHMLPENAAVAVTSFVWLKLKGPKAVLPGFLAYPAYSHIKSGMAWEEHCW